MKVEEILKELTIEEKISLQTGKDMWHTQDVERVGLPSLSLSDGPHGLRKQTTTEITGGLSEAVPAVVFPTASKLACSFDADLIKTVGKALGEQCVAEDVDVLLGPGINIKRNSLCGRNMEYFSEDPYLTGEIACAFIDGVQSKGVGVAVKHFACNNQEYYRFVNDSIVDDKALNEIYLSAWKKVVQKSQPFAIMTSYNKLNGEYCSQSKVLLKDTLRDSWGYDGMLVTDWTGTADRVTAIKATHNLEMPKGDVSTLQKALKDGTLTEAELDQSVAKIIELSQKVATKSPKVEGWRHKQHSLVRKVSAECTVLVKNSCNILPLNKENKIAVIGQLAKTPHIQGGGSSRVVPTEVNSIVSELTIQEIDFTYHDGYRISDTRIEQHLIDGAMKVAKSADTVVIVVGLLDTDEFEGYDRKDFNLPPNQIELIDQISNVNSNTVVVLQCGAPVDVSWQNSVKAVVIDYLGGQNQGGAMVDVLFGDVNPSGRLSETWANNHTDQPSIMNFANETHRALYKESIFVGYRYYDKTQMAVAYPFGYGLSYTNFDWRKAKLDKTEINAGESVTVKVDLKNIGSVAGSEVVQVYVKHKTNRYFTEEKSLKGFKKIQLAKGRVGSVDIVLNSDAFSYYNLEQKQFVVDGGEYEVLVCKNANDVVFSLPLTINGENTSVDMSEILPTYYNVPQEFCVTDAEFEKLLGRKLPNYSRVKKQPHTTDSTFSEINDRFWGRKVNKIIAKKMVESVGSDDIMDTNFFDSTVAQSPIRIIRAAGFTQAFAEAIVVIVNGNPIKGVHLMKKEQRRIKREERRRERNKK